MAEATTAPTSLPVETSVVGLPISRIDGKLKVTGAATYAGDFSLPRLTHAVALVSTIAAGRIARFDSSEAEKIPGVLAIISRRNAGKLKPAERGAGQQAQTLIPLQDDAIHFAGQYIGIVVAETLEKAIQAAAAVKITYKTEKPHVDLDSPLSFNSHGTAGRGNADAAFATAAIKVQQTYFTPVLHHNPMEMHATIATWQGDKLTLYDSTQDVYGTRGVVAGVLGIPAENVRVIDPFVGGAFGSKGSIWPHSYLTAVASRQVGRPVKLVVNRKQMFAQTGYRPRTRQQITLGADKNGKLLAIKHEAITQTADFQDWVESCSHITPALYSCPNVFTSQTVARMNVGVPCQMRAPGEASGLFALESALDELACAAKIDPLELRLRNYAELDESQKTPLPFTSKSLRQCYQAGAEKFGWGNRNPQPRSMTDGRHLIGWGMATATYPAGQGTSAASVKLLPDGSAVVSASAHDLGTGTYTILAQIAAETIGIPAWAVRVELGDTALPRAPGAGGSTQAVTVGSAVRAAAEYLVENLVHHAISEPASPLANRDPASIKLQSGKLVAADDPSLSEPLSAIFARNGNRPIVGTASGIGSNPALRGKYSRFSFGAQFVEVRVDEQFGTVRVSRYVGAYAAGRILNPKTARSQIIGAITMGLGMALLEGTFYNAGSGKIVNDNLADYALAVNADIPQIDCIFIDEKDTLINLLGAKGVGELGITGVPAAVANAVYHATGKRIRDLPIHVNKVMNLA